LAPTGYDIVIVGGGIAGSSLAIGMAKQGAKVLLLERETRFKDRVRGEMAFPWGRAEARELGILEMLVEACAHDIPFIDSGTGPRDFVSTTPQHLPGLTFAHPEMQEILIAAAETAGAEVRRGVTVDRIEPGSPPAVRINGADSDRISARLVVGADGRGSACRKWSGFAVQEAAHGFLLAGVLLSDVSSPEDLVRFAFNPYFGMLHVVIPIGANRFRAYFGYPKSLGYRLQGGSMLNEFHSESAKVAPYIGQLYEKAKCIGPLASFDVSESCVEHPYRDGVALIGDAAGTSDPTWGQGLSLSLRDARVLRDELAGNSDWHAAGNRYAEQHGKYFRVCQTVEGWLRRLLQDPSPDAALIRQRAMPLIEQDPTRIPDHLNSGPDLPLDDNVRARLFGEC
jgi:menaquinone-9 beta-reductase